MNQREREREERERERKKERIKLNLIRRLEKEIFLSQDNSNYWKPLLFCYHNKIPLF